MGRDLGRRVSVRIHGRRLGIVWRCLLMIKNGAAKGELGSAMAVGHEAEMADAVETVGQRVNKEAANELLGLELHDFFRAVLTGILPGEGDMTQVETNAPALGNPT